MTLANIVQGTDKRTVRYLQLQTLDEARVFFGPISKSERDMRWNECFAPLLKSGRARLGVGEHDRGEAYVFGGGPYPFGDEVSLARHLPLYVKHVEIPTLTLERNEVLDLSATSSEFPWPVDHAELYLKLDIGHLVVNSNCCIAVRSNVFIFNCTTLSALVPSETRHLEIRLTDDGRPARRYRVSGDSRVNPSLHGRAGLKGLSGEAPSFRSTPFYTKIEITPEYCAGRSGGNGEAGARGSNGDNGGMLLLSDIRFGRILGFAPGSIVIHAQAGIGQTGAPGGDGGDGGSGGDGTDGVFSHGKLIHGALGGEGGKGGDGGCGGRGGHGGIASPVFLSIPAGEACRFTFNLLPGHGGNGGAGGSPGTGGICGRHGLHSEADVSGLLPTRGQAGIMGANGLPGKKRAPPKICIFEHAMRF